MECGANKRLKGSCMNKRVFLLAGVLSTMAFTLVATVWLTGAGLKTNNQIGELRSVPKMTTIIA